MSASMYARRPPDPQPEGEFIGSMHRRIARALFDHDGTLSAGPYPIERGDADHQLLRGMRAMATGEDADDLDKILRLIDEHGGCELVIVR